MGGGETKKKGTGMWGHRPRNGLNPLKKSPPLQRALKKNFPCPIWTRNNMVEGASFFEGESIRGSLNGGERETSAAERISCKKGSIPKADRVGKCCLLGGKQHHFLQRQGRAELNPSGGKGLNVSIASPDKPALEGVGS